MYIQIYCRAGMAPSLGLWRTSTARTIATWRDTIWLYGLHGPGKTERKRYLPVMCGSVPSGYVKIAMENHHFSWENSLEMVIFHSYVSLPEGTISMFFICIFFYLWHTAMKMHFCTTFIRWVGVAEKTSRGVERPWKIQRILKHQGGENLGKYMFEEIENLLISPQKVDVRNGRQVQENRERWW